MEIVNRIREKLDAIPHHLDFHGQKKAEKLFQFIIVLFGIVGFFWGYVCQQLSQSVYILGAGFVLCCILVLPPWPFYRTKPLKWQPCAQEVTSPVKAETVSEKKDKATPSKPKKGGKK